MHGSSISFQIQLDWNGENDCGEMSVRVAAAPASQPMFRIKYWRLRLRSRRNAACCDDLSMRGKLSLTEGKGVRRTIRIVLLLACGTAQASEWVPIGKSDDGLHEYFA